VKSESVETSLSFISLSLSNSLFHQKGEVVLENEFLVGRMKEYKNTKKGDQIDRPSL
jgi:hypothetical protein